MMSNSQFTDPKQGDTYRVIQVDGPAMSSYEETDWIEKTERTTYVMLALGCRGAGSVSALSKWIDETVRKITNAVFDAVEARNTDDKTGVIVWRKRPSIDLEKDAPNQTYRATMRVATIPPLTEETWLDIGHVKKEGETMEVLK